MNHDLRNAQDPGRGDSAVITLLGAGIRVRKEGRELSS